MTTHTYSVRAGRLADLSVSGALVRAESELRLLSRVYLYLDVPPLRHKHQSPVICGYVARKTKDGVGIEWCEFAPAAVGELLRSLSSKKFIRLRKPQPAAHIVISRLSGPLLKHGS
jgi:hypothetical protein